MQRLSDGICHGQCQRGTLSAIVDRVYEAAFVPDGWPRALEAISGLSGSASGQFFLFNEKSPVRGATQENLKPLFDEFVSGDAWKISDSVQKMYAAQPASFVVVDDFMTAEQIEQDPARIKLRAFGIGQHLCASVPLPSGDLATFVFQRWLDDGGYDRAAIDLLDGIRPHLARAGLIAARLRLEQAQAMVSALQAIGLPAAVIEASGRILATSDLLEEMGDVLLPAAFGRLAVADPPADLLFQEAVAQNRQHGVVRSIPVQRGRGSRRLCSTSCRCAAPHSISSPAETFWSPPRCRRRPRWCRRPMCSPACST